MKVREDSNYKIIILAIAFLFVFFLSFSLGRFKVSPLTTVKILLSRIFPWISETWTSQEASIVLNVRFPRILAAAVIGASLSVAGASFQGMFRNPMVSPDILGASTGAGFGAALAILLGFNYFCTTLFSFVFGLASVLLAFMVAKKSRIQTSLAMILSGIMVSSVFSSGTGLVKLVADTDNQLPAITYWLMGSLTSVKNKDILFAIVPITLGLIPILLLRWKINLLTVSEAEARSMGVETTKLRAVVIICATLMTSASVSISGMIGWVGLVIPHFCRLIFGQDYRKLIPASALLGATFLLVVDNITRLLTASEIPIGILTSFIGAPVFIYLIIKGGSEREH